MPKALDTTLEVLDIVAEYAGNKTLPLQQIKILLHVVSSGEVPMGDLVGMAGVEQSSISRNVALLGVGIPLEKKKGAGLITAAEDPLYRRRKLVSLTARGEMMRRDLLAIK